jgi:hypothetical protein
MHFRLGGFSSNLKPKAENGVFEILPSQPEKRVADRALPDSGAPRKLFLEG